MAAVVAGVAALVNLASIATGIWLFRNTYRVGDVFGEERRGDGAPPRCDPARDGEADPVDCDRARIALDEVGDIDGERDHCFLYELLPRFQPAHGWQCRVQAAEIRPVGHGIVETRS